VGHAVEPGPEARSNTESDRLQQDSADALTAEACFVDSLEWLALTYRGTPFWTERDIVYVFQRHLSERLRSQNDQWRVFNGHRINPTERPAVSADLVIISPSGDIALGAEFKYEPCHRRPDIAKGKFPVAVWADVVKDIARADQMVARGAEVAYAICIDEGGWTTARDRSMFEERLEWSTECPCERDHIVEVLMHRVP
jgi:hypothetical protein